MLPTFVIVLREGLEAALVVGIIAAFLARQGRRDALRQVWLGVAAAALVCVGAAVLLRLLSRELPQRQADGLAAVVALVAVAFVTYMIVWMSRHARDLHRTLVANTVSALERGSSRAMVVMAFLAVLREGFETTVFLLAVFEGSSSRAGAAVGGVLGLAVSVALGWGLYRGGVRIPLARFFTVTSVVLVLVAAGLVAGSLRSAAEAGWLTAGQGTGLDLSAWVVPGSVTAAVVTGLLGIEPQPTQIEVLAWLAYAVPMLLVVLAPRLLAVRLRTVAAALAAAVAPAALLTGMLVGEPALSATTTAANELQRARQVRVSVSAAGCEPSSLQLPSGPTTFLVVSTEASNVTELELASGDRVLGEAENVTPGVDASFSLTLQPGRYSLLCPGGRTSAEGTLQVTGPEVAAQRDPLMQQGIEGYRAYLVAQSRDLVVLTRTLQTALASGDVAAAKRAYAVARVPWERAEPLGELLGGLDPAFDARIEDAPTLAQWTGFHPIERQLWIKNTTAGTDRQAAGLVSSAGRLLRFAQDVDLELAQVGNGANALLNEVSKSKITGEEERYSRLDLLDFKANVDGARAAYDALRPVLLRNDAALARDIDAGFAAVNAELSTYRRGDGYVSYATVTTTQRRALSRLIDALAEPLSQAPAQALAR